MRRTLKAVLVLGFPLLTALPGPAIAEEASRARFIADVAPGIAAQLCSNPQSPLRGVYTGALADCEAALKKHFGVCANKVVPEPADPSRNAMETTVMMAQCLVANYQGGEELKKYNASFTGKLTLQRAQWLKNLQPVMMQTMCTQKDSDFGRTYKGDNCPQDVKLLFEKCTTKVENVVIPATINGLQETQHYGELIATCITAHHRGGETLRTFEAIQDK